MKYIIFNVNCRLTVDTVQLLSKYYLVLKIYLHLILRKWMLLLSIYLSMYPFIYSSINPLFIYIFIDPYPLVHYYILVLQSIYVSIFLKSIYLSIHNLVYRWYTYSSMLRIYKHYAFKLQDTNAG